MKKTIALLLALVMLFALCACGNSAKYAYDNAGYTEEAYSEPAEAFYDEYGCEDYSYEEYGYEEESTSAGTGLAADNSASGITADSFETEKIIYTGYADIETTEYDESCAAVSALIARVGGFLESSTSYGNDYYVDGHRTAEYVIRIPRARFEEVTNSLSDIGNVTYSSVSADNISASYRDTESRLSTYRVEEERLLAMLELADTVEDMLSIEDRLADVRYNIESLTTTIRNWDSLVNYSTVTINLEEVIEYTPDPVVEKGYWEEIGEGFVDTLKGVGNFFADLLKGIIIIFPVLVLLGIVAFVVVCIVRKAKKRRAARPKPAAPAPVPVSYTTPGENKPE